MCHSLSQNSLARQVFVFFWSLPPVTWRRSAVCACLERLPNTHSLYLNELRDAASVDHYLLYEPFRVLHYELIESQTQASTWERRFRLKQWKHLVFRGPRSYGAHKFGLQSRPAS